MIGRKETAAPTHLFQTDQEDPTKLVRGIAEDFHSITAQQALTRSTAGNSIPLHTGEITRQTRLQETQTSSDVPTTGNCTPTINTARRWKRDSIIPNKWMCVCVCACVHVCILFFVLFYDYSATCIFVHWLQMLLPPLAWWKCAWHLFVSLFTAERLALFGLAVHVEMIVTWLSSIQTVSQLF